MDNEIDNEEQKEDESDSESSEEEAQGGLVGLIASLSGVNYYLMCLYGSSQSLTNM